ncbi:MAG: EAL domain-containing protein [Candidatus Doudnabacteria bacterium]|nr:EAL domain-containing protein [Candidatus Doudnabacteria bacterium]
MGTSAKGLSFNWDPERHLAAIIDASEDAIISKDLEGIIRSWSRGAERLYGYTAAEVLDRNISILIPPDRRQETDEILVKLAEGKPVEKIETTRIKKDGSAINVLISASPIKNQSNQIVGAAIVSQDITGQKLSEEKLRHQYYHDLLTGLPNRIAFQERLAYAIEGAKITQKKLGILLIDLDRFNIINNSLGHPIGDRLVQEVALRLMSALFGRDFIARLGGDEFCILVENMEFEESAAKLGQKILDSFRPSFCFDGQELFVTASIGITVFPDDASSAAALIRNADTAMYRAKEQGGNKFQFYRSSMNVTAYKQLTLENTLRKALEKQEFVVYYQPQIETKSGKIVEVESLVRWMHPTMGLKFPDEFIHAAELTGVIEPLGEWALFESLRQLRLWHDDGFMISMALNFSNRQLKRPDMAKIVLASLEETNVDPKFLAIEVTENTFIEHSQSLLDSMQELRKMGVKFSIDDFNTGYSSLSYIKKYPVEMLKIDKSFVQGIPNNAKDSAIAQSIIALGHSLEMLVVAEGVETQQQAQFLTERNCDRLQGFLFSPAVPPDQLTKFLKSDKQKIP